MLATIKSLMLGALLGIALVATAQKGVLTGAVYDSKNNEPLPGVNILSEAAALASTNAHGKFSLELEAGSHNIRFRYIGYTETVIHVNIAAGRQTDKIIFLEPAEIELEQTVVTAGKFEQRLSDVTVSMQLIEPAFIQNTNTVNMAEAIRKQPGVDIIDGQPNIRGGSGYSYGAGSRVMVLMDGLPILTADVNEVKWNFLPVEAIDRVEILKGASSALYGSSALNGVINLITAWPGQQPTTRITAHAGLYMKPRRPETAWWWKGNPAYGGASALTMHKFGNTDLVFGANAFNDEGYRKDDFEKRIRANLKIRHRSAKIKGLSFGFNTNLQQQNTSDFLLWVDADSGAFVQPESSITPSRALRFNIDPWITYFDQNSNRHSLRTRFYRVYNRFADDPDKNNGSDLYYSEYQFYRNFSAKLDFTAGVSALYGETNANLYGNHFNSVFSVFSQADYKIAKSLSVSLGLRWEHYTLDRKDKESSPVSRLGINYKVADFTFIRASYGQGFRFPSIAEKYTSTSVGSLHVFPNPLVNSETGWSSEWGLRQGFKFGTWAGFFDVAGFWTEYNDMIEFTFGVWTDEPGQIPTLDDVGFKSLNVGKARINGIELNIAGSGNVQRGKLSFFAGYTFMNPVDLSSDTLQNNMLKYRYRHSARANAELERNKISGGITLSFNSFMERIDEAFEASIAGQEIFPGLKNYRKTHTNGTWLVDIRAGYQLNGLIKISVLLQNLFNTEYMQRPGDIGPPLNAAVQATLTF